MYLKTTLALVFSLFSLFVKAQILKNAEDSSAVLTRVKFPQSSATVIVSFTEKMLSLDKMPSPPNAKKPLEELLKSYEKPEGNKDIDLMIKIYYAYYDLEEPNTGFPYLQKAYNLAAELYDQNPSNIELLKQISDMMIIVNRLPDVPVMWEAYTNRNPQVAEGWAKLALYKIQVLDTSAAKKSLEKAYSLDPKLTEIYVTALMESMFTFIIKLSEISHTDDFEAMSKIQMDFSFLQKAAAQNPKLEITKMSLHVAQLLEIFYQSILLNADKFASEQPFTFELSDTQKGVIADLEKAMKQALQNKKIVNKFFPLKALLVLETLRGNMDMAISYLEESKKYIAADVDLYKLIAFGYLPLHKYDKAIPFLKKATELSPNYDDLFTLARLQFDNYDYDAAAVSLQSLLQSYPNKFDVVYGLISIQFRQGKTKDACATLFRLQELYAGEVNFEKDSYFPYYKALCHLFFDENKDEAEKALRAVVDNDSHWAEEASELLKLLF